MARNQLRRSSSFDALHLAVYPKKDAKKPGLARSQSVKDLRKSLKKLPDVLKPQKSPLNSLCRAKMLGVAEVDEYCKDQGCFEWLNHFKEKNKSRRKSQKTKVGIDLTSAGFSVMNVSTKKVLHSLAALNISHVFESKEDKRKEFCVVCFKPCVGYFCYAFKLQSVESRHLISNLREIVKESKEQESITWLENQEET